MDEIGKIIFNALASKRAVWLPCIGTFRPEYIPARDNGDGSITPPRNEVVFSEGQHEDAPSVLEFMQDGADDESASVRYDRWLVKATERGPVVMEGIGVVNNGVFTPYESLLKELNPTVAVPVTKSAKRAKKPLSKTEKVWIGIIIACVLILAGGWTWWNNYYATPTGHNRANVGNAAVTDDLDRIPEHTGAVEEQNVENVESVGIVEGPVEPSMEPDRTEPSTTVQTSSAPASVGKPAPGFYVVGNVFYEPGNADKYIADMKRQYPELDYTKYNDRGDQRTLVFLYGSTDRAQANRERRKIEDRILQYDLWVYEVK